MLRERFSRAERWIDATVQVVRESCARDSGPVGIALAGGATPGPHYAAVAAAGLPLERVQLWQVDERVAPRGHSDSNARMIESAFGPSLGMLAAWRPFDTSLPVEQACAAYEVLLRQRRTPFALCVLGIGPDGHVASLFPRAPALAERERLTAHTTTSTFAVRDRLTLTLPPILASRTILLLADASKGDALDELERGTQGVDAFPAAALRSHPDLRVHQLVDA